VRARGGPDCLSLSLSSYLAEHAQRGEARDLVRPAQRDLDRAVHFRQAQAPIRLRVAGLDLRRHRVPGRLQPLAPGAPGRVEVDDDDRVFGHQGLKVGKIDGVVVIVGHHGRGHGTRRVVDDGRGGQVVVHVKPSPLAIRFQGQLAHGFRDVKALCAQGVADVQRQELAGEGREGDVEVDAEELAL